MKSAPLLNNLPLYLLIDPYLSDFPEHGFDLSQFDTYDELETIRSMVWEHPVHLPRGTEPVADVQRLPYLVDLTNCNNDTLSRVILEASSEQQRLLDGDISISCRIGALIETWAPAEALMKRLESMWRQRVGSARLRYLRIADRRVFEGLTYSLSSENLAEYLGPISHWHYFNRSSEWVYAKGACCNNPAWYRDDNPHGYRKQLREDWLDRHTALSLTATQSQRLIDFEGVSRALLAWQQLGKVVDAGFYHRAWNGAEEGRRQGLDEPQDLSAFIVRWMKDPSFSQSGLFGKARIRMQSGDIAFANALIELEMESSTQQSS